MSQQSPRLAALDIGTNSIRCIVVEVPETGGFRILDDEKATVRLGEGLFATGEISVAARERALDALRRMRKILDGLGVTQVEAVATSAVRKAANGEAFLAAVREQTGLEVEIVGGEEEAELVVRSVERHFDMAASRYLMLDIGGGSLELVSAVGRHVDHIRSLELGAVFLTERFFPEGCCEKDALPALRRHIRRELEAAFEGEEPFCQMLIGSGGTVTAIGSMVMAQRKESYDSLQGYEVLRSEVVHLAAMLLRKSPKERASLAGLNADRADIILAGVAAVDETLRFFGANILRINERGIREGLILRGLEKQGLLVEPGSKGDWRRSVEAFGRSCHYDREHCRQVAWMALRIFDLLAEKNSFTERDRIYLEAAALLHDCGHFIDYAQHHKHSYHLIRHAHLFDFAPKEKELIANIARYHRKSPPKKKHENFARLDADSRQKVRALAGILRLADGLDRRRNQEISALEGEVLEGTLLLRLTGKGDASVELYGGRSKSDLFESAFGLQLRMEVEEGRRDGDGPER